MDDGMLNLIITAAGTATLILLELQDWTLSGASEFVWFWELEEHWDLKTVNDVSLNKQIVTRYITGPDS